MVPSKSVPSFIWHYVRNQWKTFLAIQLSCFSWALDHTLWPVVLMLVIDTITNYTGDRAFIWSALALPLTLGAILWIGVEACYRAAGMLMAKAIPRMEAEIRMDMFSYAQSHSPSYFLNNFTGAVANKISDMPPSATRIVQLIAAVFLPVLAALVISTIFFAAVSLTFASLLAIWVILHFAVTLAMAKKCDQASQVHAESRSTLQGKIVDSLSNNLIVKLFSGNKYELGYLQQFQNDERAKHEQSLWIIERMKLALGVLSFVLMGVCLNVIMIYSWQKAWITAGEVVFIFNTSWNIMQMVWHAGLETPGFFKEIGVCRQALSIIQATHEVKDVQNAAKLIVTKGEIQFENVTFHYRSNNKLFKNKSITIHAGEKIGLVGFSGSGKSTFVNLILRYYDVESGRILIDGQDISKVTQSSLRESIAMIPQEPSLFHRTILENIRYGKPSASLEEIHEAASQAHCQEFIDRLPERYNTYVGERGVKLSGGQRQRIAMARAILKNAQIVIFDEATSALDSVTERFIQENLAQLMHGKTALVIAHRLSTLSGMDRIFVFKEGSIIEVGSHEELLEAGGHYASMWQMQAGGFLPDDLGEEEEENWTDQY